jgi:ATP-dependent Clp protease ATP-binding subunit ClpB
MDFNRLTQKSQEAVQQAQSIATRRGHIEVDGEHLLLALVQQEGGLVPRLLEKLDVVPGNFARALEAELDRRPSVSGPGAEEGKIYVSQRFNRLLVKAEAEAKRLKDDYVSVEHLLLALLAEGDATAAGKLFQQ